MDRLVKEEEVDAGLDLEDQWAEASIQIAWALLLEDRAECPRLVLGDQDSRSPGADRSPHQHSRLVLGLSALTEASVPLQDGNRQTIR